MMGGGEMRASLSLSKRRVAGLADIELFFEGSVVRLMEGGGYVVLRDVAAILKVGSVTRLLGLVHPEIVARDVSFLGGRKIVAVRASALAAILVSVPTLSARPFLEWARIHLFPRILGGSSMEEIEAILTTPCERPLEDIGAQAVYADGSAGALLTFHAGCETPAFGGDELIYHGSVLTEDRETKTLWATAVQIASIFGTSLRNVEKHLETVLAGDLSEACRTSNWQFEVRQEGGREIRRRVVLYDFETISAVGDRVSSSKAMAFRRWRARLVENHIVAQSKVIADLSHLTDRKAEIDRAYEGIEETYRHAIAITEGVRIEDLTERRTFFHSFDVSGKSGFKSIASLTQAQRLKMAAYAARIEDHESRVTHAYHLIGRLAESETWMARPAQASWLLGLLGSDFEIRRIVGDPAAPDDPFVHLTFGDVALPVRLLDPAEVKLPDAFILPAVLETLRAGVTVVVLCSHLGLDRLSWWVLASHAFMTGPERARIDVRTCGRFIVERGEGAVYGTDTDAIRYFLSLPDAELAQCARRPASAFEGDATERRLGAEAERERDRRAEAARWKAGRAKKEREKADRLALEELFSRSIPV